MFTVPAPGETRYVPNEIVVGAPAGLSTEQIADIARRNGLEPIAGGTFASSGLTLQRWRISDNRPIGEVIRGLQAEAGLQSAQPNFRFALAQAAAVSEQPADGFSAQYAPTKLHLAQAHRLSTGGGVLVAVIDTGIDRAHPEFTGAIAASFDAIGAREPPDAHGTAIAGAIISHGRLMGVAPAARLLAIRAFSTAGPDAEATTMTIVRSIEWAVAHGARVINMSFAGARDPVIGRALAEARRKGIVLVAAAGNAGPSSPPLYPAADANVIAVSATDIDDHLLDVANRGRQIALAAPGVDVLLPAPRARYQLATGTSFAAAHVAGIAALMLAKNPRLTPDEVRAELVATARDLGPKGRDDMFGAGLADAYKAVVAATGGSPQTVAVAK
jgi:subtilisin family serine protease